MKTAKKKNKILAGFLAIMLALVLGAGFPAVPAYAASGAVYTCSITPCYRHPVTGVIEDSGGEASYATGQGMVEGAIYPTGIMEVTENGEYYLTIRMSLIDYTSNQSFWVQNVGDSGWSAPAMGVTGNGTDSNGTTADVCMQVPSENCVVRGAMYVEPMGRDVIFYLYPSNYSEGNSTDMNSTMITADTENDTAQSSGDAGTGNGASESGGAVSGSGSLSAGTATLQSSAADEEDKDSEEKAESEKSDGDGSSADDSEEAGQDTSGNGAGTLQSSITQPATSDMTKSADDSTLNGAQGLSLSTAGESADPESGGLSGSSMGQQIFILVISITIAGLILLGAGAGIVYYFRKNWYRWGGGEDDDE